MVTRLQHSSSPQKSPIAGVAPGIPVAGAHRAQSSGNNFGDVSQNSQHTHQLSMGSLPLPRQASGASTASLRTGLSATPRQHHHQQQQQPQQGYFMVMDEQLDASRYASPQQAFEAVAALCRQQRDAFEAAQASWRLEKQEWKETQEDLYAAIKAMHDAVDAEMRAHNLDLQTLTLLCERNAILEELVGGGGSSSAGVVVGAQQNHPNQHHHHHHHSSLAMDGVQRSAEKERTHVNAGHSSTLGSTGMASLLSPEAETRKTNLRNNDKETPIVSGKMVALQRYDPVTDSYRLSGSGAREQPKGHTADAAERHAAFGAGMSGVGGGPTTGKNGTLDETVLRRQNAALAQQVDALKMSNQEAWEQYRSASHFNSRSTPALLAGTEDAGEAHLKGERVAQML